MGSNPKENGPPRILTAYRFLASPENLARTTVLPDPPRWTRRIPRLGGLWTAFALLRRRRKFDAVIALGDFSGLCFGALQRLAIGRKVPTIIVECNWYREHRAWRRGFKYWQMRFSAKGVDKFVVWAEREIQAYAQEFGIDPARFVFVPQHNSLHSHRFSFEVKEGDYIFAAGNFDRDFRTFIEAVKTLDYPCVIACSPDKLPQGVALPPHIRHTYATPQEFRQLMAGALMVVVPMQKGLLHSGGQQGFVNSMSLGKAVIVSDPAGAGSYIQHGVTGLLVPPADPQALRQAIDLLLSDAQLRGSLGQRAFEAAKGFAVDVVYDRICALADQAVERVEGARVSVHA